MLYGLSTELMLKKYVSPMLYKQGFRNYDSLKVLDYDTFEYPNEYVFSMLVKGSLKEDLKDFLKSKIHYTSKEIESLKEENDFTGAIEPNGKLLAYQETLDKLGEIDE